METETLFASFRESLRGITAPRFYETERGFQGELLSQLSKRPQLSDPEIIEQEHQKRLKEHGLTIRPDIIIHEPFDPERHSARTEGNLAVVELKLNATAKEAAQDFQNLAAMLRVLQYRFGVFVNIGTTETHSELVTSDMKGRVVLFAISLNDGHAHLVEEQA